MEIIRKKDKTGNRIGKDRIAVNVELLLVFEAIAETKVSVEAMARMPNSKTRLKSALFSKGLPINSIKSPKVSPAVTSNKLALKISFENIIELALQRL